MSRIEKTRSQRSKRDAKPTIVIISEGQKTEKLYFGALKNKFQRKIIIEIPNHSRQSPENLVAYLNSKNYSSTLNLNKRDSNYKGDSLFIVFDLDDNDQDKLNEAKSLCDRYTELILSNPCFEIWFLLHFEYTTSPFANQNEVETRLKRYIPDYQKTKCIFKTIEDKTDMALTNTKKLEKFHIDNGTEVSSFDSRPYTGVHKIFDAIKEIERLAST